MSSERTYEVMLLPKMEVAERFCTLREADAWMRTYNDVAGGFPLAVVAEDRRGAAQSGRLPVGCGRALGDGCTALASSTR